MFKKSLPLIVVLTMIVALVPSGFALANNADVTLTSTLRQGEPITLYSTSSSNLSSLDPQIATDTVSIQAIENLFLGLTDADPLVPGDIRAEIATAWEYDAETLTWTFTLRNDIPWVHWDPVNDEATVLRNLTAFDFEYGIKRACDPRLGSLYGAVAANVISGCDTLNTMDVNEVTDEDYASVNVAALDDTTFAITLRDEFGFFLSMTPMWMLRAVPQEVIAEYGDDWVEVGNIVTNGPFVVDEFVQGVRRVYMRNPFFPEDLLGPGNVERIVTTVVQDIGTSFALYQDNEIESANIPSAELQAVLADEAYEGQISQVADLAVFFFAFAFDKAPTDDAYVRRAFSAAVDRNAFVQEQRQGRGVPMIHMTPPGIFGAPPINQVGVGYDPDYAREQLAMSAYPDCANMPNINVVTYQGAGAWAEFVAASLERELGCSADLFSIEQQEFSVLLASTDPANPPEDRPHMWTLGWGPDYPDAHNYIFDAGYFACESENSTHKPCTEVDDLIAAAASESDPDIRKDLYNEIEERLFGPEGEMPLMPLYMRIDYVLNKPWYTGPFQTDGLFGGAHWDWRTIDQEAQMAAKGG
ncbi:MAG: hypothetical protein JXQ72_17360 [Anaerolineae bacterium]|nr:hypothetical protein [Anaerolineae bacterium]